MAWYGFYTILDAHMYYDDPDKSAWVCIAIGYPIYFIIEYGQYYFKNFNVKNKYWRIFSTNFPQFHRNILHTVTTASSIFIWRGFWLVYDYHVVIFDEYFKTYLVLCCSTFGFLSIIQALSSMNGPMSTMKDNYRFFPIYPHCYLSMAVQDLSKLSCDQAKEKYVTTETF